jgi:hypothetical protein
MLVINKSELPYCKRKIDVVSHGVVILDLRTYYNASNAYAVLESLHSEGRKLYLDFLLTFDLVFPPLYSFCLAIVICMLFRKSALSQNWVQTLCLLPFLTGGFDYLENIAIITMLLKFPTHIFLSSCAGYFTLVKWIFMWLCISLVIIGSAVALFKKVWSKGKKNECADSLRPSE